MNASPPPARMPSTSASSSHSPEARGSRRRRSWVAGGPLRPSTSAAARPRPIREVLGELRARQSADPVGAEQPFRHGGKATPARRPTAASGEQRSTRRSIATTPAGCTVGRSDEDRPVRVRSRPMHGRHCFAPRTDRAVAARVMLEWESGRPRCRRTQRASDRPRTPRTTTPRRCSPRTKPRSARSAGVRMRSSAARTSLIPRRPPGRSTPPAVDYDISVDHPSTLVVGRQVDHAAR